MGELYCYGILTEDRIDRDTSIGARMSTPSLVPWDKTWETSIDGFNRPITH